MKTDYKPEHGSYEDKLGRAIGYLIARNIWRGRASCEHVYRTSDGKRVWPDKCQHRKDGLPF